MKSVLALVGLLVLHATATFSAESNAVVTHSFKLTLVSRMMLNMEGSKEGITSRTEIRYRWQRKGQERTLIMESSLVQVQQGAAEVMNAFMSREKFVEIRGGKTNEVAAETAPDQLKTMLRDSFGVPLCRLEVDETGKEIKRTIVAGPGAKDILESGVPSALLFHPPFPPDRNEWSADTDVSMGNGGYAKGSLTYKKEAGGNARPACQVSGTLTNPAFKRPDAPITIKNARYVVTGEETFDPAIKEWIAGRLTMDVSQQLESGGKNFGSIAGTIAARFDMLP